jgi:hypothetical protein
MCNKWQEARGYENIEIHMFSAEVFKTVCKKTPIHIIWGADNIFKYVIRTELRFSEINIYYVDSPQYIKDALCDVSQGRRAASVTTVEDAGHMASPRLYFHLCNLLKPLFVWPRSFKNNLTHWHR